MSRVLSAVAWPYANGPRHIGHVAGFGVPSDVFSRYMRMAGHDVLMVSGTDEHGTPILVAADAAGVTARELADENNRVIVQDLHDLGLSYDLFTRTTTRNHHAVAQEMFRTVQRNGYMVEQTTKGAVSPSTGQDAAGPLHRGHLPDLRLRARPRRPVRQLRQPARPDRPDRAAQQDQRRGAGVRRDPALLPRPARARRRAEGLARRPGGHRAVAAERHQVQPEHPRGHPAAGDDPRHRLGHPGAGLGGPADQAALRLVRRGDRLPLGVHRVGPAPRRAGPLARLVERPRGAVLLLHGQGQHHLPLPDLARRAPGVRRPRRPRRRAGGVRRPQPPHRGGVVGVPHHGGQAVLVLARRRDLRPRRARRATSPTRCATSSRRPARRTRTATSPGRSSCGAPTTSSSRAGATWSTAPRT